MRAKLRAPVIVAADNKIIARGNYAAGSFFGALFRFSDKSRHA
jgi:hypothetical protein